MLRSISKQSSVPILITGESSPGDLLYAHGAKTVSGKRAGVFIRPGTNHHATGTISPAAATAAAATNSIPGRARRPTTNRRPRLNTRGVVLKKKRGTPETRLRQRFLNNLGLHTRSLIHVRKIATADLWSCPAIQLLCIRSILILLY